MKNDDQRKMENRPSLLLEASLALASDVTWEFTMARG